MASGLIGSRPQDRAGASGARRSVHEGDARVSFLRDPQIERNVNRLPITFDSHGVDRFGVDKEWLIRAYSPFAHMYRSYLNVTTFGMEHVPKTGRGLLIGNHSGGIGADAAMTMTSLLMNHDAPRLAHGMAEYFFNTWPFASQLMNRTGHLTGLPEHAEMLLEAGRIVVAFPEGARGTAKLYRDKYKLVRFGTGFVRLALKMKTPIYPFAFIGGEEAFPTLFHIKGLNKLIGAPYVPVAPQLVIWPLPVSCQIHFGAPLQFEGDGSETDEVIQGYVERVKESIHGLIETGLAARPAAFTRKLVHSPYDPTRPDLKR
ncbi:MAG: 1-acyl-sn-glycerol-3-phosphate acyltransferase [Sandaracinaceae bacterium]|jgi:1-acyl-sn-glycerol-3-phosphate acyltransferase|nr:1-acyl-sn-glycerol-3-phosphate acyltransferase [Sandaracinaceae bacterium]MBP7682118.1 1-acyl-sn-glycerol-3-phosphate acyltransferase [Deltaproteobacteria bacterium]MBK6811712.1 1-acyl-sn-glycerol-3-phosphate acyltransferase [Sandaracinaceae bacterium]MBK7150427.1 1-acyl-sn-glycerol-3-phosphate acyltransferase [Sandaracinaceae bacterium]MBK7778153.1 1-acyl-sn-glycerol-3-phosphate acyltransferase [Sandaracinaceae bacterium]